MKGLFKIFGLLMIVSILIAGCSAPEEDVAEPAEALKVGVSMPTRANERWIRDGNNVKERLEGLGYEVDLQYAEDDVQAQISQIENMINSGVKGLIITPIDPTALLNVLQTAAENDIKVVAYDRLLMDTPNVDYYVTFHNVNVGKGMVAAVAAEQGWDNDDDKVYNVEVFTGSPDDSNAYTAYDGIMQGLQPYLESGKVKIQSGQTEFEQVSILRWSQETAQARMEDIISGFYATGEKLNAAFTPSDTLTYGIIAALEAAGYEVGEDWPALTGQDAEIMAVKHIIAGRQYLSMFRDARIESEYAVTGLQALLEGKELPVNDTTTFDNNVKTVPTFVIDATPITRENYEEILIGGGYYEASDFE